MKKVLIVEDDLIIAMSTERMVERLGHQVVSKVTTGEEAVDAAVNLSPDIILMDIRLAGKMDGIDATRLIKNQVQSIKVIYITGNADPAYREKATGSGFEAFLIKPVRFEDLKEII